MSNIHKDFNESDDEDSQTKTTTTTTTLSNVCNFIFVCVIISLLLIIRHKINFIIFIILLIDTKGAPIKNGCN